MNDIFVDPSIDLILAPMYAGKTSEIIRRLIIYQEMGLKVLYVNSAKDNRTDGAFSTHNSTIGKIPFTAIKVNDLETLDVSEYSVIGVDEASFFPNLKRIILDWVERKGKIVIVAGLNGDYLRRPFGEINDLIPYCDSITKLTPFCLNCRNREGKIIPAHFTKRIIESKLDILVGGKDTYIPVCRKCFNETDKLPTVYPEQSGEIFRPPSPSPSDQVSEQVSEQVSDLSLSDIYTKIREEYGRMRNPMLCKGDAYLSITIPERHDIELPVFEMPKGYTKADPSYFDNLEGLTINAINGLDVSGGLKNFLCNYCARCCYDSRYFCAHCYKVMCDDCFEQKNPKLINKYHLSECLAHKKLEKVETKMRTICDLCENETTTIMGDWHTDDDTSDLCPNCWPKVKHVDKSKYRVFNTQKLFEFGIGSILDWFPIAEDKTNRGKVFYNINPDSSLYHRVMLSCKDNYYSDSWYLWHENLDRTLEQIRQKIPKYEEILNAKGDCWDKYYGSPVGLLVKSFGRKVQLV